MIATTTPTTAHTTTRTHHRHSYLCSSAFICGSLLFLLGAQSPAHDPAPFDAILKDVVVDGRVDYAKLATKHLPALNAYIDGFQDLGAPAQPLADYLNLYNATMLKAVVEHRAKNPAWKPSDNNFGVFKEPRIKLKAGVTTLDHLENEIIRKQYKEPRIHVALNCAAVSCPALIPAAYTTATLEAQLEANMKAFVTDGTRNTFDDKAKTAKLSSIFNWFAPDFGGPEAIKAYVAKYRPADYSSWKTSFIDYDWTLNERK